MDTELNGIGEYNLIGNEFFGKKLSYLDEVRTRKGVNLRG